MRRPRAAAKAREARKGAAFSWYFPLAFWRRCASTTPNSFPHGAMGSEIALRKLGEEVVETEREAQTHDEAAQEAGADPVREPTS